MIFYISNNKRNANKFSKLCRKINSKCTVVDSFTSFIYNYQNFKNNYVFIDWYNVSFCDALLGFPSIEKFFNYPTREINLIMKCLKNCKKYGLCVDENSLEILFGIKKLGD